MLCLVAALVVAAPNLAQLDAQEAVNERVELSFDALCKALKATGGRAPAALVVSPAWLEPARIRWVRACSVRALSLSGAGTTRAASLLFELDGLSADGARLTERGEARATLELTRGTWRITAFEATARLTIERARARFTDVAQATGLVFPKARTGHLLLGGLAVRDLDGDGRLDVVATDGADVVAFVQAKDALRFEARLISPGRKQAWTSGLALADLDDDGDADLLVAHAPGPAALFRNEGGALLPHGELGATGEWHSVVPSDLDGDGHLDLALLPYPLESIPSSVTEAGNGYPLRLFRGDGALGFTPWLEQHTFPKRWTLAAVAADLLGQGRPQLYVANDYGSNDLWRFEADGGVRNVAAETGVVDPGNGMSADVADWDGDGRLDLYVANMFSKAGTRILAGTKGLPPELFAVVQKFARGNTLYLARDGGFDEVARAQGVNRGLWAFGSVFTDFDADGRLDVAVANGYLSNANRKDT